VLVWHVLLYGGLRGEQLQNDALFRLSKTVGVESLNAILGLKLNPYRKMRANADGGPAEKIRKAFA
jgi:hypothetical protein